MNRSKEAEPAAPASAARGIREAVETVVFVLVLVGLLRIFSAEAFQIPSGSMATTLLGANKPALCPKCAVKSVVNARGEVEGDEFGRPQRVESGLCQNCGQHIDLQPIRPKSGDRVIVAKFLFDGLADPRRWEVTVFKCPNTGKAVDNYIKRLIGLPGETIRIQNGDIFVKPPEGRDFTIARKPPKVMQVVRRLVYDQDHIPSDWVGGTSSSRWQPQAADTWEAAEGKAFRAKAGVEAWLDYRHLLRVDDGSEATRPHLITDFEAYNTENHTFHDNLSDHRNYAHQLNWIGDLMIECRCHFPKLEGKAVFELGEGLRRYRCTFDLENQKVALSQNGKVLLEIDSGVSGPGDVDVCFANFDDRLTLWINGSVCGSADLVTANREEMGPREDDLLPARIGSLAAGMTVSRLKLYRDLYYTQRAGVADCSNVNPFWTTTERLALWRESLAERMAFAAEYPIPDDHYFMLGDNSPQSADGREWTPGNQYVPRNMVLGKALILYWPPWNWRFVR